MERKSIKNRPFKAEFERRLKRLNFEISFALKDGKLRSLLPAFASVYTYLWMHQDSSHLYNKNYHDLFIRSSTYDNIS